MALHGRPSSVASAAIFLTATLCWAAEKPQPASVETSGGSRVVSPAVVATWIVRTEPHGRPELELLVFWRGTPGWFMRADSSGSSSRVSTQSGGGENARGLQVHHVSFGGTHLKLEFDQRKRVARIQEHEVPLQSANVVLVDEVDSADGPQISRSLHVDPVFPESPVRIEAIVRRSPEFFSLLRCDAKLPDSKAQPMIDAICAQMKGP